MKAAIFNGPVIAPFIFSDMSCPHCRHGSTISCHAGGNFGNGTIDGGQGEAVRVPLAGSTLVTVPGSGHSDSMLRSLLTLSDVMSTGHHAAMSAGVKPGDTVAVVGDGAVGLSAVLAAKRLGAARIIALSRHVERQRVYIPELLTDVLSGAIDPGLVLDFETGLEGTPTAYKAMDNRTAIKSLIRVGSV